MTEVVAPPKAVYVVVNPVGTAMKDTVAEATKTILAAYSITREKGVFGVYRYTLGTPGHGDLTTDLLTVLDAVPDFPARSVDAEGRSAYVTSAKFVEQRNRWRTRATAAVTERLTSR